MHKLIIILLIIMIMRMGDKTVRLAVTVFESVSMIGSLPNKGYTRSAVAIDSALRNLQQILVYKSIC